MKDIFLKLMFHILIFMYGFHKNLAFLLERKKIVKVEKILANLHNKTEYVIQKTNLKH